MVAGDFLGFCVCFFILRTEPSQPVDAGSALPHARPPHTPSPRVIAQSWLLRGDDGASLSATVIDFVSRFRVDHAILSVTAIDASHGFMDAHLSEADYSRAVMASAASTTVVADHTKFARSGLATICPLDAVDRLITSAQPTAPFDTLLSESGVLVDVV